MQAFTTLKSLSQIYFKSMHCSPALHKNVFLKMDMCSRCLLVRQGLPINNMQVQRLSTMGKRPTKSSSGVMSTVYYVAAIGILAVGFSYAAVPLYRIFCQAYGYGGTVQEGHGAGKLDGMEKVKDRLIRIYFNADVGAALTWNFKPDQHEITVAPGETALAFYTAKNPTDRQIVGISTYNVVPFEAGQYFNKIQCFCFEEQMLNPHEEVSMPVFFYIDPEFAMDPLMENVHTITLSYTFFESKGGFEIPRPAFMK